MQAEGAVSIGLQVALRRVTLHVARPHAVEPGTAKGGPLQGGIQGGSLHDGLQNAFSVSLHSAWAQVAHEGGELDVRWAEQVASQPLCSGLCLLPTISPIISTD